MDKVVDLYLSNQVTKLKWKQFLEELDLHNFAQRELEVIDHTLGLVDETGELVGTGSVAGNVLKYIGVKNDPENPGARFNKIVTSLEQYLFNEGIFHSFVFTKQKYAESFGHLGFKLLASNSEAAFLETGLPDIMTYLTNLPTIKNQTDLKVAAIVMNANPFTVGHQKLVAEASKENDLVYVFVVQADLSLFSSNERLELVKSGTSNFKNVKVVSADNYQVSPATFPAYFLKSPDNLIKTQTAIDAQVFKNYLAKFLNIKVRYVGTEPYSRTTGFYNENLKKILEPEIKVRVCPRFKANEHIVTATRVRLAISQNKLSAIRDFVPETTWQFILDNKEVLQDRIKKGISIDGN